MVIAKELSYFSLPATDLEKSKVFFAKVLGWEVGGGSMGGHVKNTNTPCGLSPGTADTSHTIIYLNTMDLDQSMEEVKKNGGKVFDQSNNAVGRSASCEDDQGTHFSLHEPNDEIEESAKNPPKGSKTGDLLFFSIPVLDEPKATNFFGAIAAWEFGEKGAQGGMGISNLKGPDGGLGCGHEGHRPSFWFRVDNIKTRVAIVQEAGGTAGDIFQAPEGTMSECLDDQGVKIGLVEPAPGYRKQNGLPLYTGQLLCWLCLWLSVLEHHIGTKSHTYGRLGRLVAAREW
jgi:predicted enzyme related to lactoylglutathione lyase